MLNVKDNRIWYSRRGEQACIFGWGTDVLRFQASPGGRIREENWNLLEAAGDWCERRSQDA